MDGRRADLKVSRRSCWVGMRRGGKGKRVGSGVSVVVVDGDSFGRLAWSFVSGGLEGPGRGCRCLGGILGIESWIGLN